MGGVDVVYAAVNEVEDLFSGDEGTFDGVGGDGPLDTTMFDNDEDDD